MAGYRQQLLKVEEVAAILNVSKSGVWDKANKQAGFPKPFKLSAKQTRWVSSEIDDYILAMMDTRIETKH